MSPRFKPLTICEICHKHLARIDITEDMPERIALTWHVCSDTCRIEAEERVIASWEAYREWELSEGIY